MGTSNSKTDQEQHTTLTGLYPSCVWDPKTIRKLVLAKKLAPIHPGKDESSMSTVQDASDWEECPICFLFYQGGLNRSSCCKKSVCTECLLQVKKPNTDSNCPFCNRSALSTIFTGPLSKEERQKQFEEEQKVVELKIKIRNEEIERDKQREEEKRKSAPPSPAQPNQNAGNVDDEKLSQTPPKKIPPRSEPSQQSTSEIDLEEMLINEAIRLSLNAPSSPARTQQGVSNPFLQEILMETQNMYSNRQSSNETILPENDASGLSSTDHPSRPRFSSSSSLESDSDELSPRVIPPANIQEDPDQQELEDLHYAIALSLSQK